MKTRQFILRNLDVLSLWLFLQITEVLHLFFINNHEIVYTYTAHGETRNYYWDDIIYMVCAALCCSVIFPFVTLCKYIPKELKFKRTMVLGLLFYSIIEFCRLCLCLAGVNVNFVIIDGLYVGQFVYLYLLLTIGCLLYTRYEK